jgi:hypothetical protein
MATVAAWSKRGGGRGRKALVAVLDNEANISAGKAAAQAGDLSASSAQKAKRAPARSGKAAKAAAAVVDDVAELQGMLERLRLEKEKAEEMVRERDEVIRKKEEEIETKEKERERLQAELRKVQRAKEFKPTVVRSQISRFSTFESDLVAVRHDSDSSDSSGLIFSCRAFLSSSRCLTRSRTRTTRARRRRARARPAWRGRSPALRMFSGSRTNGSR